MGKTLLIRNGIVATLGAGNRVLQGGGVLCRDGRIERIGPASEFSGEVDAVVDAGGKLVMPGLINAHTHFYSSMARGLNKAERATSFLEVLENLWWRLDRKLLPEDCYLSALVSLIDAVKHGTTTLIDHHASPFAVEGSLDRIAEAVQRVGLRASLCYEVSDRDGEEVARAGIEENVRFLERCRSTDDDRIQAMFGIHAAFTLSDRTLERVATAGNGLGAGFHLHVAEARSDQESSRERHGLRVVERLHRFGILGERTIAAHCVHVDEAEIDRLGETGTAVVHNPQSNMNNAVGIADIVKMAGKGVLVGLGTDAMTVNMLEELRVALWAQRLGQDDPGAGFDEVLSALVRGNPAIAGRYWTTGLGELEEGLAADIILIDYHPPTPLDETTILGHLAFGLSQAAVDTTIVGGRILMKDRKLTIDLDEEQVAARSRELAAALWNRF